MGATAPVKPLSNGKRRKLWQVDERLICPIIGTCFSIEALRAHANRTHSSVETASDFEVHATATASAKQSGRLGKLLNKALDRQHTRSLSRAKQIRDSQGLLEWWREAVQSGRVAGPLWAIASHPHADETCLSQVYGDIHMLSHLHGANARARLTQQADAQQAQEQLRAEVEALKTRLHQTVRDRDANLLRLREENRALQARLDLLNTRAERDQQAESAESALMLQGAVQAMERLEGERAVLKMDLTAERERADLLMQRADEMEQERDALESAIQTLLAPTCENSGACDGKQCAHPDLKGRCLLYVGGVTHLRGRYRDLVKRYNGRLIHHDGGVGDGAARLESLMSRADLVICPVDCVSHDACLRSKKYCKHNGKPFISLRSSGLASLTRELHTMVMTRH
ncbi:hypothetical protein MAIT1_01319 [Magnetofaba australis IT-1]|uniref:DUF2325 domain-containing protein n=1 Tax=Magnetofaba australis IT-1 TaxID=1434232 RepID=A0A1Y2K027_9PROT|nr:hypothetical protein MAIT1_01319 [Magnetofaba australis IT-1]